MPDTHGDFVWYELMTSDAEAAKAFYSALIGWTSEASGQADMPYHLFSMGKTQVAGMMALTDEMKQNGARPCWLGYIAVDDVDATAGTIKSAGGSVHIPPADIPEIGRFAMVSDPQGSHFYIMRSVSDETSQSFAAHEPRDGHCAWNELMTSNQSAAMDFYTGQFGWKKDSEMDMGPMGKYEMLRQNDFLIGAMMTKPDEVPVPLWSFYFRVPDIDAAVETTRAHGGQVTLEPSEIPGGEFQMNGIDPQGAAFALIGKRGA